MPKGNIRSDKKFNVKVWVKTQDKLLFRSHCFDYHLSMMFVGEKYLITCLKDYPDSQLQKIIEDRLNTFNTMNSKRDGYEVLGIHVTNDYWQKMAYFAVQYRTTIAKIGSCLFDHCLSYYGLQWVGDEYGLTFTYNHKQRFLTKTREDINERTSDY